MRETYQSKHGIEQSRRDFKRDYPSLYEYARQLPPNLNTD